MVAPTRHARAALSERLRQVRREAQLTGARLADALGAGWAQPKVSKIESGRQLPSEEDIRAWASATGTDPDKLLALLARARHEHVSFRDAFDEIGGAGNHQDAIGAVERAATIIAGYQPNLVHGLLQTANYAREILRLPGGPGDNGASQDDIDQLIAARMRRQAILYEPGRHIVVIVGEGALRNRVASDATMREQLEHIARMATTTHATIGVTPFDRPAPVMLLHGWEQRDDIVTVETAAGDLEIADPAEVARYERYIKLLLTIAATGDDAAVLCRSIATT